MAQQVHGRRFVAHRWLAVLCLVLVGAGVALAGRTQVRAHALLVRSEPAASSTFMQPPTVRDMWFSESLESGFSSARVLDASGQELITGEVIIDADDPTHMRLPLTELPPGIYTVAWQTLSRVDGHEWFGSFPITLLNPDGSFAGGVVATSADTPRELPSLGEVFARWLVLFGSVLFFGMLLFQRFAAMHSAKPGERPLLATLSLDLVLRFMWVAGLVFLTASWLELVLRAYDLGRLGQLPDLLLSTRLGALTLSRQVLVLGGLLATLMFPQPRPLRRHSTLIRIVIVLAGVLMLALLGVTGIRGQTLVAAATLLVTGVCMIGLIWSRFHPMDDGTPDTRVVWPVWLVLAGAALFTLSVSSHAGAAPGSGWTILGDYIHLLAAAAWLGGLLILPVVLWRIRQSNEPAYQDELPHLLRRYSTLAGSAVLLLALTGLFSSFVEFPNLESVLDTAYGRVLLIKLFLIALALEIAYFNNRDIRKASQRLTHFAGLRRFHRQVTVEAVVGLGILLAVAVLVQALAPLSLAATTAGTPVALPFNSITDADDLYVHVLVTPNQIGENRFWVHLYHQDGSDIGETQLVRLRFNHQQLGQAQLDLAPLDRDAFEAEGAYLSQAGPWDISVYVRRRGMDDALVTVPINVPPLSRNSGSSDLWQNPVPGIPSRVLAVLMLVALGVIPLIVACH